MLRREQPTLWLDDPKLAPDEFSGALGSLARIDRLGRVAGVMFGHLRRLALARPEHRLTLLDVASGTGALPISWAHRAQKEGWRLQITLTDARKLAVDEQRRRARGAAVDALCLHHNALASPLPGGFDVVCCSFFLHRLDDHQAFCLLQAMQGASTQALLVGDLERSNLNLLLAGATARLLCRSPVVRHDAVARVRSAFTLEEFRQIAESALPGAVQVARVFPGRFVALHDELAVPETVPAFA